MPISKENAKRYPANWKQIRAAVLDRAGNACEGSPKFPDCRIPNRAFRINSLDVWTMIEQDAYDETCDQNDVTRIVLTIGHLDHTPEHCSMDNLKAWCQRCRLNYDLEHHMQNARSTRRKGKAVGDMFDTST